MQKKWRLGGSEVKFGPGRYPATARVTIAGVEATITIADYSVALEIEAKWAEVLTALGATCDDVFVCPCCGSEEVSDCHLWSKDMHFVECRNCGLSGPLADSQDEARLLWESITMGGAK